MKAAFGGVAAACIASVCCIGPVVLSLLGAGALGASAVAFEPYRPWFIGVTIALLGAAFYSAYRRVPAEVCADGTCPPESRRTARRLVWIAATIAVVLIAFPYYIGWLV